MTPSEESVGFYYELGRTITSWAHVELALYWVAMMALSNKKDRKKFAIAFFSIDAFYNKLKVTDRLFKSKYKSSRHIKTWAELFLELETLGNTRNQLAHNQVIVFPHAKPGRRYALLPRLQQPNKFKQKVPTPSSDAICIRQIIRAQQRFTVASHRLEALYYDLKNRRAPLPASFSQLTYEMSMDLVTRRLRAIFSTLASPSAG